MTTPEQVAAWRLFVFNWRVLGGMTATLMAALAVTPFWIEPGSLLLPVAVIGGYAGYTYYHLLHSQRRDPFVIFTLGTTGQMLLIPAVMTPLTYIAASTDLPLQDTVLNSIDEMLHLDWPAYYNFVYHHHALLAAAVWSYSLIGCPVFGVPIALGWTERYRRLQVFTLAFAIALIATTIISAFVPAIGTYKLLHVQFDPNVFTPGGYLSQLHDLPLVRNGALREMSFRSLTGLITFPSFHAASAVLYLWALWPVRWLGPVAAIANIMMVLAAPVVGGHYFIDIFAGIAVAIGAIAAATFIASRLVGVAGFPGFVAPLAAE